MFTFKIYNSIKTFGDIGIGINIAVVRCFVITLTLGFIIVRLGYIKVGEDDE